MRPEMSLERLPAEILTIILAQYAPTNTVFADYLDLRLVNRLFDQIVSNALFDAGVGSRYFLPQFKRFAYDEVSVFRHWRACLKRSNSSLPLEGLLTEERGALRRAINEHHKVKVNLALRSAIQQIGSSMKDVTQNPNGSTFPTSDKLLNTLTELEQRIYLLCKIAICLHGLHNAWNLLGSNIEDHFGVSVGSESIYIPSHDVLSWIIYAAAYLNNLDTVRVLLEPLEVKPAEQVALKQHTALPFFEFACSKLRRNGSRYAPILSATHGEQRWVKIVSSTLTIASSLGHVDMVLYLLRLEPNIRCKAFRTQLYRTSKHDALRAAISNDQRETFQLLMNWNWLLDSETDLALGDYLLALEAAVKCLRLDGCDDNILDTLLKTCGIWRSPYYLERILQSAAQKNDIRLGEVVLQNLDGVLSQNFVQHSSTPHTPRWNQILRPRAFAIGTAAYFGHIEFVEFLLQYRGPSNEASPEAIECAIHSLTCHVKTVKYIHIAILKLLLQRAKCPILEVALVKAVCKRNKEFVAAFVSNVNLKQKACFCWSVNEHRRCCSAEQMKSEMVLDLEDTVSLGEVALAAALKSRQFEIACMLVDDFGLVLKRHYVRLSSLFEEPSEINLAKLRKHLIAIGMKVEETNDVGMADNILCSERIVIIQPRPYPGIAPVEFNIGSSLYCML